jgi:hypothetical protein
VLAGRIFPSGIRRTKRGIGGSSNGFYTVFSNALPKSWSKTCMYFFRSRKAHRILKAECQALPFLFISRCNLAWEPEKKLLI